MLVLRKVGRRLRALLEAEQLDRELAEEVRHHLELEESRLREEGLGPEEARRLARARFGGVERVREETRDARGVSRVEDFLRDARLGLRGLLRRPAFTLVVLLTLGGGVGGAAAIYGAVDGILLTPLPYREPERLVALWEQDERRGEARREFAPANFLDLRERARAFDVVTAMQPFGLDWSRPEGPIYLPAWLVYEGFFEAFGTRPALGRTFLPEEHAAGRADVVVLGWRVWVSRFGADPAVVGRVLNLDGRPHVVLGVMPEGFALPGDDVVWAPAYLAGWEKQRRTSHFFRVFARLRPGVALPEAEAELGVIAAQLAREHPRANADLGIGAVPLEEEIVGGVRRALLLLLGAVGFLLGVVTANVASLQLARATSREREFAVRGALGAGPGRVARQLVAENAVLALGGAALGCAVAWLALRGVRAWAPAELPRVTELRTDADVLSFALVVAVLAVCATGVLPTLLGARARLGGALSRGGRTTAGHRPITRVQGALVVGQLCLALVLLIGAGLLSRSFLAVLDQPRGFRTDGVAALTVQSWGYYQKEPERAAFVREVVSRLAVQPGIRAAGMTSSVPLMETIGAEEAPLTVEGAPPLAPGEAAPLVQFSVVTPGLLEALGIPLRAGRSFRDGDDAQAPAVALVSEAFARRYLGERDAVGRRISLGGSASPRRPSPVVREVIGVVGDVRRHALHEEPRPTVYLPHAQLPTGANAFVARGAGDTGDTLRVMARVIHEVNPAIPFYNEAAMADLVGASVRDRRFLVALLGAFALLAVILAAAGTYGLMSFVASERVREVGVRMALGASPDEVLGLVLRRGLVLGILGIASGLGGAAALTRILAGLLHGVTPLDAPTFAAGAAALLVTVLAASWHPAWCAAHVDPVRALREDEL